MVREGLGPERHAAPQEDGSRRVLDLVADKWAALVVHALAGDTHRYNHPHREIEGVSRDMLTQTLRGLECNGLVQRTLHATVPRRSSTP